MKPTREDYARYQALIEGIFERIDFLALQPNCAKLQFEVLGTISLEMLEKLRAACNATPEGVSVRPIDSSVRDHEESMAEHFANLVEVYPGS